MKNLLILACTMIATTSLKAATIDTQDSCLEKAALSLSEAYAKAEAAMEKTTLKCSAMPGIDVKDACINEGLATYEKSLAQAKAIYDSEVDACL